MTADAVHTIDAFIVTIPRDTPYLGALGPGERVNERGYFVRARNRTVYPAMDRSIAAPAIRASSTNASESFTG